MIQRRLFFLEYNFMIQSSFYIIRGDSLHVVISIDGTDRWRSKGGIKW